VRKPTKGNLRSLVLNQVMAGLAYFLETVMLEKDNVELKYKYNN
jgi:hypothetical protein